MAKKKEFAAATPFGAVFAAKKQGAPAKVLVREMKNRTGLVCQSSTVGKFLNKLGNALGYNIDNN